MSNILNVKFENGSRREYTEPVYQYDYGRVLQIDGLNANKDLIEVHFAASNSGSDAVISIGTVQNGILTVQVPDSVLINEGTTLNYYITAYIYITDEVSGTTQYEIQIPVTIRPKPGTTDTPQERDQFSELVEKVNSNLKQMKELNTSAEGSATAAGKSASAAAKSATAAADSASTAKNSAEAAAASAEAAEESRSATEELQKKYEQNENKRIEAEKKREQETAEALEKVKEATDLIISQAGTIAFRINQEDGGLDVVILDAEGESN